MAIESAQVTADMIEASEFPELSNRYSVYAVPLTVVNDRGRIEGGMPEPHFLQRIIKGLEDKTPLIPTA